tara:strand:+ start:3823 stop:4335 length:513 start_codon:yes stop_codon:yes gene_type:complete
MIINRIYFQKKNYLLRKFLKKDIQREYISWFKNQNLFKFSRHKDNKYNRNELIDYYNKHNSSKKIFLAIIKNQGKILVGTITIYIKSKKANIGILIGNKKFHGKKIGHFAIEKLVNFLLKKTEIKVIHIGTNNKNIAMKKICKFLNMKVLKRKKIKGSILITYYINNKMI